MDEFTFSSLANVNNLFVIEWINSSDEQEQAPLSSKLRPPARRVTDACFDGKESTISIT